MCLTSPAVITGADMDVFQGGAGLSAPVAQASAETPLQGSAVFGFLGDWGFIGADRLIPLISATVNGLLSAAAQQTSGSLLEAHPEPVLPGVMCSPSFCSTGTPRMPASWSVCAYPHLQLLSTSKGFGVGS